MLAVARVLVTEPDLFVRAEPSSGLAPNLFTRMDRGYVLTQGRIQMEDTCANLYESDEVQEKFLGAKQRQ